jgi:pyruvate, water dikinase
MARIVCPEAGSTTVVVYSGGVIAAYTRPLAELRRADAAEFGGKSANLGELLSSGIPVPPGFAVGVSAYRSFVEESGLGDAIDSGAIRSAPLPDALRAELGRRYEELGQPPVAVRSSALGEDSEEASYAGQQESFLWVHGLERVCDAVRDCWASLYTPEAIAYRARLAGEAAPAMGVTVQSMVDAEVSGVMFTCNPVSGDPSMVALNAGWGLGLAVVGGEVTPDDYLVSKVTGEVVRQTVGSKQVEYVPDPAGQGPVRVEVPGARRDEPCLGEEQVAVLVELARRIERHFGSHQDVEWAIERGGQLPEAVRVLQARPVTKLPEQAAKPSASALSLVMSAFGATAKTGKRP